MMAEDSGDVLGSWEDQVDSGLLDERLKKITVSNTASEESVKAHPLVMPEDTGRTEYKPQVRILKREPNTKSNSTQGSSPQPAVANKPMKTLEQRAAEYAQARMRIFGEADAGELLMDADSISSSGATNCASPPSEKQYKVNKVETKSDNSIIRQPLGPDGSKGFHSRR